MRGCRRVAAGGRGHRTVAGPRRSAAGPAGGALRVNGGVRLARHHWRLGPRPRSRGGSAAQHAAANVIRKAETTGGFAALARWQAEKASASNAGAAGCGSHALLLRLRPYMAD